MPLDLSTVREYLSREGNPSAPRKMFIFAGDEKWHGRVLSELLDGFESCSLWVSDQDITHSYLNESQKNIIHHAQIKHTYHWLGSEKKIVIFDATESFDVDAFAAISGIVIGGGVFILLMPAKARWDEIYPTHFGLRLRQHISNATEIIVVDKNDTEIKFSLPLKNKYLLQKCALPFLTQDQKNAVEQIEADTLSEVKHAFVIVSDRGRGKSAALGLLAARLIKSGLKHIVISAPRLRAADIIFKHIEQQLPDAELSRGCVKLGESTIQFYSPDQLLLSDIEVDLLLVDEAAAIPVPILESFLNKFEQCVFATTVHGYEGTGRGFALRFYKILDRQKPGWNKLQLQTPVRWPENDFLENWMFRLLCLNADIVDAKSLGKIKLENLQYKILSREQLHSNAALLNEVFSLLVLAHYRTRPSDLKSLLDDEAISLYVTLKHQHVVAVALIIREGCFTEELSTAVYRGERRPQGHLLAQALTYHCGIEHASTLDYARVMRIAVHPELQQQGIGTQLLDYIVSCERSRGCDAIGTSFGMNKLLLDFWKQAGFDLIRIGFTREQTSGEHAAIMLMPLSHQGVVINLEAAQRFNQQINYWLNDVLKDLPGEIKEEIPCTVNGNLGLNTEEKKDLWSFLNTSRNYELCIAAVTKVVLQARSIIEQDTFPEQFRAVISAKVVQNKNWKVIATEMGLNGKDAARDLFKKSIIYLTEIAADNITL